MRKKSSPVTGREPPLNQSESAERFTSKAVTPVVRQPTAQGTPTATELVARSRGLVNKLDLDADTSMTGYMKQDDVPPRSKTPEFLRKAFEEGRSARKQGGR